MNDSLRWLLVSGCLCIVFLEAPQDLLQVFQDCSGAYPAQDSTASSSTSMKAAMPPGPVAGGIAPCGGSAASPSLALTGPDLQAVPMEFPAASPLPRTNRRSEDDLAHEPRDDRTEFRAEFAAGR